MKYILIYTSVSSFNIPLHEVVVRNKVQITVKSNQYEYTKYKRSENQGKS